jgi:hypothetical protein
MWVHYTSGIASYNALQKGSFKKPRYCLNVQSHVSYLQTSCVKFVCSADSTHCTTHCTVALVLQIPYLLSSFFASFLPPASLSFLVSVQL